MSDEYFDHKPELLVGFLEAPASHNAEGYYHLELRFGYLSPSARHFERPHGTDPLDGLEISTLIGPDGSIYGWNLRYANIYRATILDLEPRVKLLKAINAKLGRWDREWGDPATFGTYAHRICKAVGTPSYLRAGGQTLSSEPTWNVFDMGTLIYHLDQKIAWAQAHAPQKKVAANG